MPEDRSPLPPVRLHSDAELARDALATPLLTRAVKLARWAGPGTRVGLGGELVEEQLPEAAEVLGLGESGGEGAEGTDGGGEGLAYASEAWRIAVDTGLVEVEEGDDDSAGTVSSGDNLALVTGGGPQDVLGLWLDALDVVLADATAPLLDDIEDILGEDGTIDVEALDWDPEAEAAFLDGVLGNLYLLTVTGGGAGEEAVPLPVLAASVIVPDDMGEPTDDVLEQVSQAMMRLDDQFRLLETIGLVEYRPVDEALMAEEGEEPPPQPDDEDVSRYGLVWLTPLGLYGIRARLLEGDRRARGRRPRGQGCGGAARRARVLPRAVGARRDRAVAGPACPADAARELLTAAEGDDGGAPLRRLHCQQALTLVGPQAEPAVRAVLDNPQLGGLARVWLAEHGAADVPAPPESMIFWLAIDTIAAQLSAVGEPDELQDLVESLVGRHSGFFDAAWRVDHPATATVLEAMGRLHRDKKAAKEARKAAFKARSRAGS